MTSIQISAQEPNISAKIGWLETGEGQGWVAKAAASLAEGAGYGANGLSVADAKGATVDREAFIETLQKLGGHPAGPAAAAKFSPGFSGGSK